MKLPTLWSSSQRASAIADSLFRDETVGIGLVDMDGQLTRANARFQALLRAGEGGLAWGILTEDEQSVLARALRAGRPTTVMAILEGEAAPGRRALRVALVPVPSRGALVRVTDHTHEQDLEEQLGQSQRLQAVGELAGGIAHDFNNLLTAILGATDDLQTRHRGAADCEDLDQIRASAVRGADLVRQLLAFSRQQTLQPRVLELNERVRHAAALLTRLLGADVTLRLDLEEPGRRISMDPMQLDQVLMNLAVNARHAMPDGGKLIIASGHAVLLRPELFGGETIPAGRYASLTVTDTGSGIPRDILPRIFEPFFTTRRDAGGTGLGLSMVHGIVRQSSGFMAVESSLGEGTCFRILLPRHEDNAVWQSPPPPVPVTIAPVEEIGIAGAGPRLLLVDDEAPLRRLAARALGRDGWDVIVAASAEEALEGIAPGAPALALVVSDVVMPGLDGPALVRVLREARPGLPAILMSGFADSRLREELAGAEISFLAKPFSMADLVAAANRLTDRQVAEKSPRLGAQPA